MRRLCSAATLAIGFLVVAGSDAAFGQTPASSPGSVGGAGVTVIKRQPELIRMQLEVMATGKGLKDALTKLKVRRKSATTVCTNLGAVAGTLAVGPPRIAPDLAQRQRMMGGFITRSGTGKAKKPEAAPPVNVSAWLTAEWPLKGNSPEELLLASQSLRDAIKSELAKSMPKATDLSPEQEEMQEEAAPDMGGNGNGPKPGEPTFVFAAKISDADYVKAAARAFAMAKAHAQRLADAAGMPLGELRNVEGNDRQAIAMMNYPRQYYNNGMLQQEDSPGQDTNSDEATGANPAEVRLTIAVAASFALGK